MGDGQGLFTFPYGYYKTPVALHETSVTTPKAGPHCVLTMSTKLPLRVKLWVTSREYNRIYVASSTLQLGWLDSTELRP